MIAPINIRGFMASDPLDRLPAPIRSILPMVLCFGLSALLLYVVFDLLAIAGLKYGWLYWAECIGLSLLYMPVVIALRKSSSLLHIALLMILMVPADILVETHQRMAPGGDPLWWYNPDGLLGGLHPLLRIVVVWLVDALVAGPVVLWLARLLAPAVLKLATKIAPEYMRRNAIEPEPSREEWDRLFPSEWTEENVPKPERNIEFHILRILGLAYLVYLLFLLLGAFGAAPWPGQLRDMLEMTYANPPLAANTFTKISVMIVLALLGAYNRGLRWHTSFVLLIGHAVSVAALLFFHFTNPDGRYNDFLLISAIVDGLMCLAFIWIMIRTRELGKAYRVDTEFPEYYSIPRRITTLTYQIFGGVVALALPLIFWARTQLDGEDGIGAVFGFPDASISNAVTKFAAFALLAFMLARRDRLREHLYRAILLPCIVSVLACTAWSIVGIINDAVPIQTRAGNLSDGWWYILVNLGIDAFTVVLLLTLRRMVYRVDYSVNGLSASTAQCVMKLHDAFFNVSAERSERNDRFDTSVLHAVDAQVTGIRSRKRGLLNFPFWIAEHLVVLLQGPAIAFSSMSHDERRWFLRYRVLRSLPEQRAALIPEGAEALYKIGYAINALISMAHYSNPFSQEETCYIPPDARDRLQGDYPAGLPPYSEVASLPRDPNDPPNNKPGNPAGRKPLIAPRIAAPMGEPGIPDEVDFVVIGSGAGGAVMAYRLACERPDATILVVERGPRFSPLQDHNDNEMEMIRKLYKEGGLQQTKRFDLTVLQGECVGGTTVINNGICVQMPEKVRELWENVYDFNLSGLSNEYNRIASEIEIGPIAPEGINSLVADRFTKGIAAYNMEPGIPTTLNPEILNANFRNHVGDGTDNIGNRRMRKRSMLETYIPWAEGRGNTTVLSETTALRYVANREGRAEEVLLRTKLGHLRRVRVKKNGAVIVAGGVIASSHFLMRSDVQGPVGTRVSCNLGIAFPFAFKEELHAYDGMQITMAAIVPQFKTVLETYFNPPATFAAMIPFYFHRLTSIMESYPRSLNLGALVGSEPNGVVERKPSILDGRAITWKLGEEDRNNFAYALETLVRIGHRAGAQRTMVPLHPGIDLCLTEANVNRFVGAIRKYPLRTDDFFRLGTGHPQGGNMKAGAKSKHKDQRVVDENFRVVDTTNVYVADASLFPTSIAVNPQWTVMAVSSMAAKAVVGH